MTVSGSHFFPFKQHYKPSQTTPHFITHDTTQTTLLILKGLSVINFVCVFFSIVLFVFTFKFLGLSQVLFFGLILLFLLCFQ